MTYPILITRFEPKATAFATDLVRAGVAMDCVHISPILKIDPIPENIPAFDMAIFTSTQAIKALPVDFDPMGQRAFCVGEKTTTAAQERGFDAVFLGENLRSFIANWPGGDGQIVYFRGRHISTDLIAALPQPLIIKEVINYEQTAVPLTSQAQILLQREQRAVLPLFSPRSADLLLTQITSLQGHVAVCISEKVAAVCEDHGLSDLRIAASPHAAAMVDMTKQIATSDQTPD